ncbi:hypothetical protein K505DRAFT_411251 [Melanomma pulvis-pyrius CBS 109.77]|uniref:Eisosome protein 1 n=1 Tax=Melanomma pulvis-pyrius CBS 109.77 TaxID=1314802 RepID=A0A6A6WUD3_9PLEO|nr:hypothetical protein K505DRAFT_411251 [Melanomma pulvis-pyrius CBS 109.77]
MATQTQTAANDANNRPLKDDLELNTPKAQTGMRCPDPSAHHKTKNSALQDQASAAALHSTRETKTREPLASDGKLSSASAATSLKHARAQDLPGYPIVGIDARSSAGTAANIAHANQKSPEWWKPEHSTAAGKAALLASDYKPAPMWQPEASAAGSKAALLAHKDGVKTHLWTPGASADGNSAANIAMRKRTPEMDQKHTNKPNGALLAATGAVSNSGRKRAQSTPAGPLYPDSANSARNALSAATMAASPSMRAAKSQSPPAPPNSNRTGSGAMEAARIQHSKSISRDMYTSNPPVALEVEEKRHNDALRASAISMAKKMYDVQQNNIDQAAGRASKSQAHSGATSAHSQQQQHSSDVDIKQQAMQYIGIQEAAQKLAAERLAKIGPDENAAFRSYYGYEKPRSKLTMRRGRDRASSNPEPNDSSDDDDLRSRRIRSQMSQLNQTLAEVDAKKQEQDRKNLIAAAERKVHAQMLGMDKKIFDDTGKMSPAMIEEWDAKARAKAAANSETRMENHGKIHIGHGKYVDQADVDAVAQARIQPTLDEITEKTEKRRAEEEEQRLDLEEKKRQAQAEKERAAGLKSEEKRIKDEVKKAIKARTTEEKAAAKQEKEAEREKKTEEKRTQKEEKRKSREMGVLGTGTVAGAAAPATVTPDVPTATEEQNDDLYRDQTPTQVSHTAEPEASSPVSPTSPTSPTSPRSDSKGLKSFLNKFKRRSKHSSASADNDKPGFIGGVALRESSSASHQTSVPSSPAPEPTQSSERRYSDISSISSGRASSERIGRVPQRTVSGLSAVSGNTDFEEAKDDFDEKLAPPVSFGTADAEAARKGSPNRDSKFHEVGI